MSDFAAEPQSVGEALDAADAGYESGPVDELLPP